MITGLAYVNFYSNIFMIQINIYNSYVVESLLILMTGRSFGKVDGASISNCYSRAASGFAEKQIPLDFVDTISKGFLIAVV